MVTEISLRHQREVFSPHPDDPYLSVEIGAYYLTNQIRNQVRKLQVWVAYLISLLAKGLSLSPRYEEPRSSASRLLLTFLFRVRAWYDSHPST